MGHICVLKSYPDSVNLVKPPQTTMPNTLTALPISQYPTALPSVSGKEEDFDEPLVSVSGLVFGAAAAVVAIVRFGVVIEGCWVLAVA